MICVASSELIRTLIVRPFSSVKAAAGGIFGRKGKRIFPGRMVQGQHLARHSGYSEGLFDVPFDNTVGIDSCLFARP